MRERAVRLVFEQQDQHASQWAAIVSIAEKMGCSSEALRALHVRGRNDLATRTPVMLNPPPTVVALSF